MSLSPSRPQTLGLVAHNEHAVLAELLPKPWRVCLLMGSSQSIPLAYQGLLSSKEVHACVHTTSHIRSSTFDAFQILYPMDSSALLWASRLPLPAGLRRVGPTPELYNQLASAFPANKPSNTRRHFIVDAFAQKERGVLFALAREQINTDRFDPTDAFDALNLAQSVHAATSLTGAFTFHVSQIENTFTPFAVSPFLEDSALFTQMTGPNLPLLSLYDTAGFSFDIPVWQSPASLVATPQGYRLANTTLPALYVDLDETLVLNKTVSTPLLKLIEQTRAQGLPVTLLTKHPGNLEQQLAAYDLARHFTKICHLPPEAHLSKGPYITENGAVFFEDSYMEKKLVHKDNPSVRCLDAALASCFLNA